MNASLYDVLRGRFDDGRSVESVHPRTRREHSIVSNLGRLLNTRREALSHLEDYGLPDISDVYREMPGSVIQLKRAIEASVERYEPRLCRVRVEHQSTDRYAMQLVFLLTAETLDGDRVRFKTTFSSEEEAHVTPVINTR